MPLRLTVTYGVCKSLWEVHDAQPKLRVDERDLACVLALLDNSSSQVYQDFEAN
jgi:hypothetical protein